MALSLSSLVESIDKREMQRLARQFLTTDLLPMGEIQRWLEQRWQTDTTALLLNHTVTPDLLGTWPSFSMSYNGAITGNIYANGVFSKVVFDSFDWDNTGGAASVTTDDFTVRTPGIYVVDGRTIPGVGIGANVRLVLAIFKNGAEYRRIYDISARSAGNQDAVAGSAVCKFAVGDVITLQVFQATGAAIPQAGGQGPPYISFSAVWTSN